MKFLAVAIAVVGCAAFGMNSTDVCALGMFGFIFCAMSEG